MNSIRNKINETANIVLISDVL